MGRSTMALGGAALVLAMAAAPAGAAGRPRVAALRCQQVREALAAGKPAAEVAREIGVSEARVKFCTSPRALGPTRKPRKAPRTN